MDSPSDSDSDVEYEIEDEIDEPLPFDIDDDDNEAEEEYFQNKAETIEWSSKYHSTGWNETRQKHEEEGSFNLDPSSIRSPKDAFLEFVDEEMLQLLVNYTNAEAVAAGNVAFKPVTAEELLGWLSCSITAGLTGSNHTELKALWTTDPVYGSGFYRSVMSVERYKSIARHIRFDDSVARRTPRQVGGKSAACYQKSADRLALVRPVIEIFRKNFRDKYNPGKNVTVDERIVSFRGRVVFRVYSKGKPDPYGVKIEGLADALNFYFSTFEIYTGKTTNTAEIGHGRKIVLKLTEHFFGSGRRVVFDNFFTSVPLCQDLVAQNLSSIGTLRKNKREIPVLFQTAQQDPSREIGSCIQLFNGELMITSYLPKKGKHVLMLSSDSEVLPSKPHGQEEQAGKEQLKPAVIEAYNQFKGGVDCTDMVTKKFSCQRITRRWSKAVFENFVDISIHNAFVLFHWANPTVSLTKRKFIEWLAKQLAIDHVKARKQDDFGIHTDVKEMMDTFITNYDALYGPTVCPTSRCNVCSVRSQLKKCVKCNSVICNEHCTSEKFYRCGDCANVQSPNLRKPQKATTDKKTTKARCQLCPRSKDIKTDVSCQNCGRFVCTAKKHNRCSVHFTICSLCNC